MNPSKDKIYIVFAEYGESDDYRRHDICVFENKGNAEAYCISISTDLKNELMKDAWERDFDSFNFSENFIYDLNNWLSDDFPAFEIEELPLNLCAELQLSAGTTTGIYSKMEEK